MMPQACVPKRSAYFWVSRVWVTVRVRGLRPFCFAQSCLVVCLTSVSSLKLAPNLSPQILFVLGPRAQMCLCVCVCCCPALGGGGMCWARRLASHPMAPCWNGSLLRGRRTRNEVGLFRAMLLIRADRSAAALNLVLEWTRRIDKHRLQDIVPNEVGLIKAQLHGILLASWLKKEGARFPHGVVGDVLVGRIARGVADGNGTTAPVVTMLRDTKLRHKMISWAQCAGAMVLVRKLQAETQYNSRIVWY